MAKTIIFTTHRRRHYKHDLGLLMPRVYSKSFWTNLHFLAGIEIMIKGCIKSEVQCGQITEKGGYPTPAEINYS